MKLMQCYIRAYVKNARAYHYGKVTSFTTPSEKAGEPVDLGLSVKWSNWNVGASSVEEYGGLYTWGDPTGTLVNSAGPGVNAGGEISNIDVFSIEEDSDGKSAFINYLHITNGAINQAFTFEYKKRLNETKEELIQLGIIEMRERYKSLSREIIVPFEVDMELKDVIFTIPQRGDKKKLLDLSILNVKQYKADRMKQAEKLNPEQRSVRLMKEIQEELHLEHLPIQIECFDNSNIQGSDPVAACVVFKKAKPSKQDYRKYNIKTVVGADDYASMKEVVRRRYQRAIEEKATLPDLLITDGGKGQMGAVKEVLDELNLNIPIAGLAKDGKHRTSELLYGFPPQTIGLKQNTPLFRLLTQIQDEVHRFKPIVCGGKP